MSYRQADVFVEMKSLHFRPIDVRGPRERTQKLDLRCCGSGDYSCLAVLRYRASNRGCCLFGRTFAQRAFIVEYFEQHARLFSGYEIKTSILRVARLYKTPKAVDANPELGFIT